MKKNNTDPRILSQAQNNAPGRRPLRAFLVGILDPALETPAAETLDELEELTAAAGMTPCGRIAVRSRRPTPRLLVGAGKAAEIRGYAAQNQADVIVFDDPLTPAQQRNWEKFSNLAVIDRREVILAIFAARAQTREAVLQVQLAQARYDLPRLKRRWTHLSRQRGMRGGTGLRGEGEQQIEVDARIVKRRIHTLVQRLEKVRKQRRVQRTRRLRKPEPVVAVVGYTNAGKSSLLRALSGADVLVEDQLFATLDPTVRRVPLPDGRQVLLCDTVGFVRKLPHQLVEAFKATLEEAVLADFLIEILDITSPEVEEHHRTTRAVLEELGAADKPGLLVFNKIDRLEHAYLRGRLRRRHPGALFVSAKTGEGLDHLKHRLAQEVALPRELMELLVPHDRYELVALLHRTGSIVSEKSAENGIRIQARVPRGMKNALGPYALPPA